MKTRKQAAIRLGLCLVVSAGLAACGVSETAVTAAAVANGQAQQAEQARQQMEQIQSQLDEANQQLEKRRQEVDAMEKRE